MKLQKYRRGRYRQVAEVERGRKVQRAVAKELARAAEVKAALRERLDPQIQRYEYDADGRPAA